MHIFVGIWIPVFKALFVDNLTVTLEQDLEVIW